MLSRRTTLILGKLFNYAFQSVLRSGGHGGARSYTTHGVRTHELYDFLYERDYDPSFCALARTLHGQRGLQDFVMQLHTGEAVVQITNEWTWEKRRLWGNSVLVRLAQDALNDLGSTDVLGWFANAPARARLGEFTDELRRSVELDGYVLRDGRLREPESDVLNTAEEAGALQALYQRLLLSDEPTAAHHLKQSESHYLENRWDDCISQSRKYLELVLLQVAVRYSEQVHGLPLPDFDKLKRQPVLVRNYLKNEHLIDADEHDALWKVYGLLSGKGNHPFMAQSDQARLLRQLALIFAQFIMLRLEGRLQSSPVSHPVPD